MIEFGVVSAKLRDEPGLDALNDDLVGLVGGDEAASARFAVAAT
jgi:hypothetical protein